jgi:hypothetical protein
MMASSGSVYLESLGMIKPFGKAWIVVMSIAFAVAGWFCIFRTQVMVTRGRKNYGKSNFARESPFSNFALKESYPTYIRCAGIFIWVWLLAFLYLLIFKHFR